MVTRPLLNYFGGKWNAAEWIISHFPPYQIYVEVFGGGGSILLRKERSKREILNDLDDEIVNLYRCVRDHGPALKRLCELTPHSRTEYLLSHKRAWTKLERARRTVVKSYFGIGDSIFNERNGMRMSKSSYTCVAKSWVNWCEQLDATIDRFKGVSIEKRDWRDILKQFDSSHTLFYLDPPYVLDTRSGKHNYRHDFTDDDHIELLDTIQRLDGFVILSGYNSPLYRNLPWKRVNSYFRTQKLSKEECLWINPACANAQKQMELING